MKRLRKKLRTINTQRNFFIQNRRRGHFPMKSLCYIHSPTTQLISDSTITIYNFLNSSTDLNDITPGKSTPWNSCSHSLHFVFFFNPKNMGSSDASIASRDKNDILLTVPRLRVRLEFFIWNRRRSNTLFLRLCDDQLGILGTVM